MELPDKKASRIKVSITGDFDNEINWQKYFQWMQINAEKFQLVFRKYLKS